MGVRMQFPQPPPLGDDLEGTGLEKGASGFIEIEVRNIGIADGEFRFFGRVIAESPMVIPANHQGFLPFLTATVKPQEEFLALSRHRHHMHFDRHHGKRPQGSGDVEHEGRAEPARYPAWERVSPTHGVHVRA